MDSDRVDGGFEARLGPRGIGRFFSAAFLAVWVAGWVAGECFALWLLIAGAIALVTGSPPAPGREPLQLGPTLAIGLFLMFWLAFWTLGGVLAIRELLRLVWAEDRFSVRSAVLSVEWCLGPFRSRRDIPRDDLRDIRLLPRTGAMIAETAEARVELTRQGTPAEREQLLLSLRRELRLDEHADGSAPAELPAGWQDVITPEGTRVLVPDVAIRMTQARVAAVVAFVTLGVTVLLIREAITRPSLLALAILVGSVALVLTWGAIWLARGRMEWRIEAGRLVLQRRFGPTVTEQFAATRLELVVTHDGDGDLWYRLDALSGSGRPPTVIDGTTVATWSTAKPKSRQAIHREMNDDAAARRLAAWLAQRAELPFDDRTTPENGGSLEQLKARLAGSGGLGKIAVRIVTRLEPPTTR